MPHGEIVPHERTLHDGALMRLSMAAATMTLLLEKEVPQ
jgi:hypothetical protein